MARLEELVPRAAVREVLPDSQVTVVSVPWFGSEALELTYKTPAGKVANQLIYGQDEPGPERSLRKGGRGALTVTGRRKPPVSGLHTCSTRWSPSPPIVGPLPRQITAVYDSIPSERSDKRSTPILQILPCILRWDVPGEKLLSMRDGRL